jgi:UDP-glucose 4-epimerase
MVTGGNGFIGRYTVNALRQANYKVAVIDMTEPNVECDLYIKTDITGSEEISVPKCKAVIHAAASLAQDQTAISVNCLGTYNTLVLSSKYSEKFVYISSVPVLGKPIDTPITEKHMTVPETVYHVSKLCGELLCRLPEFEKLNPIILRIASPIGVGMPSNRILPAFLNTCLKGETLKIDGNGGREQNYVDVRDITSAIISAVERENTSGLFLIAGHTISNIGLARLCCDILQKYPMIVYTGISDAQENYKWRIDASLAENELGYAPQFSLEQSILDIAWALKCE